MLSLDEKMETMRKDRVICLPVAAEMGISNGIQGTLNSRIYTKNRPVICRSYEISSPSTAFS